MNKTGETYNNSKRGGLVYVEHKGRRRITYDNPLEFPFERGDLAIVEAERGIDAGIVKSISCKCASEEQKFEFKIIRRASTDDLEHYLGLREQEVSALEQCRQKVEFHQLAMKIVDAEYRFDRMKLFFYFTSDQRVDFRELVKDLAAIFRTRIELRQIGARDEVKRSDGFGICGRQLCCICYMNNFQPITTAMAKNQHLLLNPNKLSGLCGRLKCCLHYEHDQYVGEDYESKLNYDIDSNLEEIDKISD